MTWHYGPFLGWDTETTGPEPAEDRIVTATVVQVHGSTVKSRDWLVNPGVEISEGATKVHGISTEHASTHGADAARSCAEIRDALYAAWAVGQPIIAYNASFDFTVLDRELHRHHGESLEIRGPIIDPYTIDKHLEKYRRGSRTLTATCAAYNVKLEDAHTSVGDALAACRLAWKLAQMYPVLHNLAEVNALQAAWRAEWAAGFIDYLRRTGKAAEDVDGQWPLRRAA